MRRPALASLMSSLILAVLVAPAGGRAADDTDFEHVVTGVGQVGLTISNFGFFGNNFNDRTPSFEFPLGSEVEHMVRGGVWVGAVRADTGDTLVTTGTTDGRVGDRDLVTEWHPHPDSALVRRSTIINDRNYSTRAISEEDFFSSYNDTVPIDRTNAEDHRPLGVLVTQRVLGWSYEPADAFAIVELEVENLNPDVDLLNLRIGMYAELASGFKGRHEEWPPSGWFRQKVLEFDPARLLVAEHNMSFDNGQAPQWGAIALLGTRPDSLGAMQPGFRWWRWAPGDETRDEDAERYVELATPGFEDVSVIVPQDDPVELLSVGPWPLLAPGERATAAYAFIGGYNLADLQAKADWAREAFRRNYILPAPPPSPRLFVDPRPRGLTIRWDRSPESVRDPSTGIEDFEGFRIYLSRGDEDGVPGIEWSLVGQADKRDGRGFDTGLDHLRQPFTAGGTPYDYRLDLDALKDGHKYWVAVTAYDMGDPETPSLESGLGQNRTLLVPGAEAEASRAAKVTVFPNPYRGRASWDGGTERERFLWFAHLPPRAEIRIYTLAGDWVDTIDFDSLTYRAANAAGVNDPEGEDPVLSGGIAAWDLLSWNNQPVATGLYVYSVRDLDSGRIETGRFMVLK